MIIKCPYCGYKLEEKFLGTLWKGIKTKCKKCGKWYEFHTEKGYIGKVIV